MSFLKTLKKADIYRDIPRDFTEQTLAGAIVSTGCIFIIAWLFVSETFEFLTPRTSLKFSVENPLVNSETTSSTIRINLDVDLLKMPCAVVSVDAQDAMGTHKVDIEGDLKKIRLDQRGMPKKDHMSGQILEDGSEKNPLDQKGEGCNVKGYIVVKKVPGNFHISGHSHQDLMEQFLGGSNLNVSHHINHLWFGQQRSVSSASRHIATGNPLGNTRRIIKTKAAQIDANHVSESISSEYYLKLIPSIHKHPNKPSMPSYQQVAHNTQIQGRYRIPAIYFRYDMSPVVVQYIDKSEPFSHFIVQLCAIVGGVFTVLGILNSFVHVSLKSLVSTSSRRLRTRSTRERMLLG